MTYVILANGFETARTHCPNEAVSLAMLSSKICDESLVTVESHGVWGKYAAPEMVGKPCVHTYDWKRAKRELMGY
jgi:hypothetical protein